MLIARLLVAAQDGVDVYVEESRHLPGSRAPGFRTPSASARRTAVAICSASGRAELGCRYGSASQWSRRTSRARRSPSRPAAVAAS